MNRLSNILALVFLGIFSLGLMHGMIPHVHHSHDHQIVDKDNSEHHHHNHDLKGHEGHSHNHDHDSNGEKDSDAISKFLSHHSHSPHSHASVELFYDKSRTFNQKIYPQLDSVLASISNEDILVGDLRNKPLFSFYKRSFSELQIVSCPLRGPPLL